MASTLTIQPEIITLTDFGGGWMPDLQDAGVPPNGLQDVNNLLPDRETGTLETRKGFSRFADLNVTNFTTSALHAYSRMSGKEKEPNKLKLIAVIRKDPRPSPREANDIQLWAIDVGAETAARIDDTGRIWNAQTGRHWGQTINGVYYGGSEIDPMYEYRPFFADGTANPDPYDPDASMGQYCPNGWAVDTAYVVGDRVFSDVEVEKLGGGVKTERHVFVATKVHTSKTWNKPGSTRRAAEGRWENLGRYIPLWVNAHDYKIGDEVSYLYENDNDYPRGLANAHFNRRSTFICVRDHTSSTGNNEPPGGPWEPRRAPISTVAKYHANRLFIRDGNAGTSRLHYSEAVQSDSWWDPTAWEGTDIQGSGWIDFRTGDGDDVKALCSLGQYLIISKRRSTFALSGYNPSTWTVRQISDNGCIWKDAMVAHNDLVYFLSDQGFYRTDGVSVQEVPNGNFIRDWLKDNLDLEDADNYLHYKIHMTSFKNFIWISFPGGTKRIRSHLTLVYDPDTSSFWKLDIASYGFAISRPGIVDQLYFAKAGTPALVMRYAPETDTYKDDTGLGVKAIQDIPWLMRTGWQTFGASREQRRFRRVWAMVRGATKDVTLKLFRNYINSSVWTVTRTTSNRPLNYVEGKVLRDTDPWAVAMEISGIAAPQAVVGIEMQTQFRRKRYNRGAQA